MLKKITHLTPYLAPLKSYWQWLYLLLVSLGLYLTFAHAAYDDPFITYRYAENLRAGLGFVYNPGEFVLSTTTPLFAVLLAMLGNLGLDLPLLANFIAAVSIAWGGLCLWGLGQCWQTPLVGWSGLLLYPAFPVLLSTVGSETPLFLALVLGAFLLYARQRYGLAVLLITLAILTRSDAVLAAAVLGIHYLGVHRYQWRQPEFWRNQPWFWIGISAGLLLVWHGFAWRYYGSPLPITLAAKQAQGRMAISQHFAPGLLRVVGWYAGGWPYWVELGLFALGVIFAFFKKTPWRLILAWTGLYFLAYTLLGVTGYFWYYAPLVPGWIAAIGLGITFLFTVPLPGPWRASPRDRRIRLGLVRVLLTVLCVAQVVNIQKMSRQTDPRYAIYRVVGEWLAENTPEDARVGALEVGIIGYYAQRPMVDFAGLIQPEVADLMQWDTTYDDTAVWAVQAYLPEYLVLLADALPQLEHDLVPEYCQPVRRFAVDRPQIRKELLVYYCTYD